MDPSGNQSSGDLIQKVHDRVAAANAHDAAGMAAFYAADTVLTEAVHPAPVHGRAGVRKAAEMMFTMLPDLEMRIINILADGDLVAAEVHLTATNTGPFVLPSGQELPPSGNTVRIPVGLFIRFGPDGLIVEEHRYLDLTAMMRQLGAGGP